MKILFIFFIMVFIAATAYAEQDTPVIVKFNNLLTVRTSLGYNLMIFDQTGQDDNLQTNCPWDFGLELGIKNVFAGFSVSIPFLYDRNHDKSQAFNASLNHYRDKSYSDLYFRYYNGFNDGGRHNIDLRIINAGFSYTHIFGQDHSVRAVYKLDSRQTVSNGSFLVGGGMFFSSIRSDSAMMETYSDWQNSFYFGPTVGYSHTFVIKENYFINVLSVFGANGIISNSGFSFGFQALPRFSIGYHGKKQSINLSGKFSYLVGNYNTELQYGMLSGDITLAYLRRFF